jgi:hypothetical protein
MPPTLTLVALGKRLARHLAPGDPPPTAVARKATAAA